MTPEERLDRLERIVRLFVRAGLRYRRELGRLEENLNIVINTQIGHEERFATNESIVSKLSEQTDQRLADIVDDQTVIHGKLETLTEVVNRLNTK
jgi:hypothetical protein